MYLSLKWGQAVGKLDQEQIWGSLLSDSSEEIFQFYESLFTAHLKRLS